MVMFFLGIVAFYFSFLSIYFFSTGSQNQSPLHTKQVFAIKLHV